jgi:hypothetical protein
MSVPRAPTTLADGFRDMPSLPPLPSALVDWAQVVSAVLSLLAIALALLAIWKSSRDIAHQRRIVHELEVLRDLSGVTGVFGVGGVPRVRSYLLLLPDPEDLPCCARQWMLGHAIVTWTHSNVDIPRRPRWRIQPTGFQMPMRGSTSHLATAQRRRNSTKLSSVGSSRGAVRY